MELEHRAGAEADQQQEARAVDGAVNVMGRTLLATPSMPRVKNGLLKFNYFPVLLYSSILFFASASPTPGCSWR